MKKGISLIVLVITIIVMIIIAGAIIISLSNGNVIAKATMGRIANDRASISEVATNRLSEYAVMTEASVLTNANIFAAQGPTSGFSLAAYTTLSYPTTGTVKGTWTWDATTQQVWLVTTAANQAGSKAAIATLLGITTADVDANPWIRATTGAVPQA